MQTEYGGIVGCSRFTDFARQLKKRLDGDLPGLPAQALMSPSGRDTIDPGDAGPGSREGAVLILLFPEGDDPTTEPETVFTVRHTALKHHGGQISFPGGRREEGESLAAAALREAREEVGVDPGMVELLGRLTPLFVPPSRFVVHPFVGVTRSRPDFRIDESEVSRAFTVRLRDLIDPANRALEEWTLRGTRRSVPCYRLDGELIWGATAMMTSELLTVLTRA